MRRRSTNSRWVECFGVVTFDLHEGQRVECMQPKLTLTPEQEAEIAFLCFPDANLITDGDSTHYFVFGFDSNNNVINSVSSPNNNISSSSSSPPNNKSSLSAKATELFGVARFRQAKDSTIPRGALQKSVFVLSRCPFPSFLETFCQTLFTKILDEPEEKYTTKEFKRAEDKSNEEFCNNRDKKNKEVLCNLNDLLSDLFYNEVSNWPRIASCRRYSPSSLMMFGQPFNFSPYFETPIMYDGGNNLMGVRAPTKTIRSHVCIRDYTSVQQLRNLLALPVDTILSQRISVVVRGLFQQFLNRREPWFMKWCRSQGFNLAALSLDSASNELTPPTLSTQDHIVSLHEACWQEWIGAVEDFEDIPPSPIRPEDSKKTAELIFGKTKSGEEDVIAIVNDDNMIARILLGEGSTNTSPVARKRSSNLGSDQEKDKDEKDDTTINSNNNTTTTTKTGRDDDGFDPFDITRRFSVPSQVAATVRNALETSLDEAAQTLVEMNQTSESISSSSHNHHHQKEPWSDIKLSSCLHHHLQKLPKFWELMIASEDICVIGPDARTVSSAIVGLRSLLGSVPFVSNLRPFLTINNREVDGLEVARDRKKAILSATTTVMIPTSPNSVFLGHNNNNNINFDSSNRFGSSGVASPMTVSSSSASPSVSHNNLAASFNNNTNNTASTTPKNNTNNNVNNTNPFVTSPNLGSLSPPSISAALSPSASTLLTSTTTTTTTAVVVNNNRPSLVGTTNPFFVKHFEMWPHLICFGESDDNTHKMHDADSDKRAKQQFQLKTRVFSSRHFLVKSDKSALEQLASCAKKGSQTTGLSSSSSVNNNNDNNNNNNNNNNDFHDFARQYTNELNQKFFGLLERIVDSILHSTPDMLYVSDEAIQGLFEPQSLLEVLKEQPASAFEKFKTTREALMLYAAFLQSQTFVAWLQRHMRKFVRQQIMVCTLQELIGRCPVNHNNNNSNDSNNSNDDGECVNYFEGKVDVLHLLQWELMKQLEAPVLDVEYLERLYHLNRASMPLRDRLWSEL